MDLVGLKAALRVLGAAAAVVVTVRTVWPYTGARLILNITPSAPLGLYVATNIGDRPLRRGMWVLFPVPNSYASYVYERGWLPYGVPMIKEIGAIAGDEFCVNDDFIRVNGYRMGPVLSVDRRGNVMPRVRGCFRIKEGDFLPLGQSDRSFDGRYMGAQPTSVITGILTPIWNYSGSPAPRRLA